MDQDDIVLAPWTTIKYRVSGSSLGNVNQSQSGGSAGTATSTAINTLNNLYPGGSAIYPPAGPRRPPTRPSPCGL